MLYTLKYKSSDRLHVGRLEVPQWDEGGRFDWRSPGELEGVGKLDRSFRNDVRVLDRSGNLDCASRIETLGNTVMASGWTAGGVGLG